MTHKHKKITSKKDKKNNNSVTENNNNDNNNNNTTINNKITIEEKGGILTLSPSGIKLINSFANRNTIPKHVENYIKSKGLTREQLLADIENAKIKFGLNINNFNIGIFGASCSGKTTIINGLRGLHDRHEDACRLSTSPPLKINTSNSSTTTSSTQQQPQQQQQQQQELPQPYSMPSASNVVFWDFPSSVNIVSYVPGLKTASHYLSSNISKAANQINMANTSTGEEFFRDYLLYLYDALVFVCIDKFNTTHLEASEIAYVSSMPVIYLRNKFDESFRQQQKDLPTIFVQQLSDILKEDLTDRCMGEIFKAESIEDPIIFCISGWRFTDDTIISRDETNFLQYIYTTIIDNKEDFK
eukprot:gene2723-3380_t